MKHIIAKDPKELVAKVSKALAEKHDLHAPLFVGYDGMLVQRMIATTSNYSYSLVNAADLDDLTTQEENLILLGFDYAFSTVLWYGRYLQWMCRWNNNDISLRDAVKSNKLDTAFTLFEHAERGEELKLVEDVQAGLQLEPTAKGGYVVSVPYPLLGS